MKGRATKLGVSSVFSQIAEDMHIEQRLVSFEDEVGVQTRWFTKEVVSKLTKRHHLVLFKGTAHLDPLLSADFGAQVPVLSF